MWFKKASAALNKNADHQPRKNSLWKKIALTTCLGVGITFGSVYADNIESQIPTVYHVYVDGEHLGIVDNKRVVQEYVEEKIDKAEQKHKDLPLTVGEEVTYVPEKMFRPAFNNEQLVQSLEDELSIKVDGVKIEVSGKPIGFVASKEQAVQALEKIKTQYISSEKLKAFEKMSVEQKEQPVDVGDSTIIDVSLSEKVSLSNEKISPKDILTVNDMVKLLKQGVLTDQVHTIKEGEVLGEIASSYNLSSEDIKELNPELKDSELLQIGQELNVTDYEPYLDVLVTEKKRVEKTLEYDTEIRESDELYKGEQEVKQEGQDGSKNLEYEINKTNGKVISETVINEETMKEPVTKVVVKGTKVIPSRGTGNFKWPAVGGVITSKQGPRWGAYHKGIDIAGVSDRSILAADNGVVTEAGRDGGYGNKVVIDHNNGYKTIYAHLSSIKVSTGQTVKSGQTIGKMGTTGHSTGIHLHFEVYKDGNLENPLSHVSQ
ncbi:M23 family metallopeptidase [Pontibacillus sp. ALD_SL1]|uniref:M23 family metallopeptidase n=1 Tax=Pontibacillus sp. ALD_SL1 TaxID=2777185 RepID=UPI001A962B86|nr:M23 family metallopeptidase [Pontibacillus sp. ALD_SL1]QST00049.1 M23 family metallopeptidase [Pontibacillus sp. ALD_SL1]